MLTTDGQDSKFAQTVWHTFVDFALGSLDKATCGLIEQHELKCHYTCLQAAEELYQYQNCFQISSNLNSAALISLELLHILPAGTSFRPHKYSVICTAVGLSKTLSEGLGIPRPCREMCTSSSCCHLGTSQHSLAHFHWGLWQRTAPARAEAAFTFALRTSHHVPR